MGKMLHPTCNCKSQKLSYQVHSGPVGSWDGKVTGGGSKCICTCVNIYI